MPNNKIKPSTPKERKGDTSRTSSQGQKLASGGSKKTDNKGRPKEEDIIGPEGRKTKSSRG